MLQFARRAFLGFLFALESCCELNSLLLAKFDSGFRTKNHSAVERMLERLVVRGLRLDALTYCQIEACFLVHLKVQRGLWEWRRKNCGM